MNGWLAVVVALVSAVAGLGLDRIIRAATGWRGQNLSAHEALNDQALKFVVAVNAEAQQALASSIKASERSAQAEQKMAELTRQVDALTRQMAAWRTAILDPTATLPGLRLMVTSEPSLNGR